jgi:hypothetical protein
MDANSSWTWQLVREITHYGVWKVFGQVDPIGRYHFYHRFHSKLYCTVVIEYTENLNRLKFVQMMKGEELIVVLTN